MIQRLEDIKGISKATAERLRNAGIHSVKKLAQINIDDLSKIKGIPRKSAEKYIKKAKSVTKTLSQNEEQNIINSVISKSKSQNSYKTIKIPAEYRNHKKSQNLPEPWFPLEYMQKIRFYHHKIKDLEVELERIELNCTMDELKQFIKYIKLLNINYKTQSQIKILKELELTPRFYDPIEQKEIEIWDIMFECSRALWVLAQIYNKFSKKFENANDLNNSIIAMVECSRAYKTASYFSRACTRQEYIGSSLNPEELEFKSEESRLIAQSKVAMREENKNNFFYSSKLYSGLSILSQRLLHLKEYSPKKYQKIRAQYNYDMGKACFLKSRGISVSDSYRNQERKRKLQEKANYYFYQAEEVWEDILDNIENLTDEERKNLQINLSIVNENILESDVEIIDKDIAFLIQDPDPIIIVPENIAYMIPRTIEFLTKYPTKILELKRYKNYQDFKKEIDLRLNKIEKLKNEKAATGRMIKELKTLYENNDININNFTALLEKYLTKFEMIENAINKMEAIYKDDDKDKDSSKGNIVSFH